MFNWQSFLDSHNIGYVDRGRNVSKGNLALKCPFCGDDPSEHMNVSLQGFGYACWRDAQHRGRNNATLVQALLKCSWSEANQIVSGDAVEAPTDIAFSDRIASLMNPRGIPIRGFQIPSNWRPLISGAGPARSTILEYIKKRGYSTNEVLQLAKRYNIHYCISESRWKNRVLLPIYDARGQLVNCTGRAISENNTVRYRSLETASVPVRLSGCLFDLQTLARVKRGNVLLVNEGPFDVMRMNWIGEPLGIHSTCVFTQNVSEEQASILEGLAFKFEKTYVMFDNGAELQSLRAQYQLGFRRSLLPPGVKDPGQLSPTQALEICRQLLTL